jgi:non-specific serine/threonine protein kinase
LSSLVRNRLDEGQPRAAFVAVAEAMQRARASCEPTVMIAVLECLACCTAASSADAAVMLAAATVRQRRVLGFAGSVVERDYLRNRLVQARGILGPSAYQRAWDHGQAATLEQATRLAEAVLAAQSKCTAQNEPLTPRELDIARLLSWGLTNKQIAAELVVSPGTVRSHVEHILFKLDLHSRAQIAVWATERGLVTDVRSLPPSAPRRHPSPPTNSALPV